MNGDSLFFKCVKFKQQLATMTDYTMLAKKEKRFDLQSGIMFWRRKTLKCLKFTF